jgi:hypothetical protein
VRSDDVRFGTLNLYYDAVIPYRAELVAQAQELADLLAKHVGRVQHENGGEMATTRRATGARS